MRDLQTQTNDAAPGCSRRAIGARIKHQRRFLRLTQREFAAKAGISVAFLADIEHGRRSFSVVNLAKIAFALRLSCDEIVFGKKRGEIWATED